MQGVVIKGRCGTYIVCCCKGRCGPCTVCCWKGEVPSLIDDVTKFVFLLLIPSQYIRLSFIFLSWGEAHLDSCEGLNSHSVITLTLGNNPAMIRYPIFLSGLFFQYFVTLGSSPSPNKALLLPPSWFYSPFCPMKILHMNPFFAD